MKRKESSVLLHKWYDHIDKFRQGNFNDAEQDVKIAWITFVDNILGKLSRTWRDDKVKANKNLSLHITPSDEAYAMLISKKRMDYWVNQNKSVKGSKRKSETSMITNQDNNEDEEINVGAGSATPEFHQEVDQYYDYFESIQTKRKTEDEGLSWENGYTEAITTFTNASLPSAESLDSFDDAGAETEQVSHSGIKLRNISFEANW
jgi:hypothetical protein